MSNVVGKNHRTQVAQTNISRLHQAAEAMDLTINVLSQNMAQKVWSSDFISYLVTPGIRNNERDYRIIQQLKNSVSRSDLVQNAYLYSPLDQRIYDCNSIYDAESYKDWSVLEEHYQTPHVSAKQSDAMTVTNLICPRGRLLIVLDLNVASRIGTLVYELNVWDLCDALGLKDASGNPAIFVYDENGTPIFRNLFSYESLSSDWNSNDDSLFVDDISEAEIQKRGYYRYISSASGWTYLMPMDEALLSVGWEEILPIYLPASILFMVISVLFAFYISRSIYRPINRLMTIVTQNGDNQHRNGITTVDFLEDVYADALGQRSRIAGLMSNIAPEILDAMLTNLLVGKKLSEQRVSEILAGVGEPIHIHDRYLVAVCQFTAPRDREVNDTELNLHLLSIKNLIEEMQKDHYYIYDLHTEKMMVDIVMVFPENYSATEMKYEYNRIYQLLMQMGERIPYHLQMERGSIYQNILDIRFAHQEAVDKLKYQSYLDNGENTQLISEETVGMTERGDGDREQLINRRYIKERIKSVVQMAGMGDRSGAEVLVGRILEDMGRDEPTFAVFKKMVHTFLDELTEKVVVLPLNDEDRHYLELSQISAERQPAQNNIQLSEQAKEYSRIVIRLIQIYSSKNRYKYVEKAKEYIGQHYADSNLSLNDVGEYIGISASYLSELFNEITGEKFSGYLAAYRVERAKTLLCTTNITIKEIGFLCGFNSIQNFIRVFKKYTDQTPGHFRGEQ